MSVVQNLAADALETVAQNDGIILDVRSPAEHDDMRLARPHAFVPLGDLNPDDFMRRRGLDRETPVYTLCKSGMRATAAAEKFAAAGYKAQVIAGGILACAAAGEEIVSQSQDVSSGTGTPAKGAISLERQVRMAAGTLVFLGVALGATVQPWFLAVPVFVGLGLVYAGMTDRCGMALVLARLPWNRAQGGAGAACTLKQTKNIPAPGNADGKAGCA
jgi:rhodanese-related sulfurtransferase